MFPFEQLPSHLPPYPFEAFTAFITRTAEQNHYSTVELICDFFFPDLDHRVARQVSDLGVLSFGRVPKLTGCSEDTLQATTFFHLARKFDRSTHPQAVSRFLKGCITPYVRWCTTCLKEASFYRLHHRCLLLEGCPQHNQCLCDVCPVCTRFVPLLISPLHIGYCPYCHSDFRTATAENLTDEAQIKALYRQTMIMYLLTPQPWENYSSQIVKLVGTHLKQLRQSRRVSGPDIAERINITSAALEGIEYGQAAQRGGSFLSYFKYAEFLGVSLHTVFKTVVEKWVRGDVKVSENWHEELLVRQVEEVLATSKTREPITQQALAEMVGVSRRTIQKNRLVVDILKQFNVQVCSK